MYRLCYVVLSACFCFFAFLFKTTSWVNSYKLYRRSNIRVALDFLQTHLQPALQTTAELIADMYPVSQPAEAVPLQGRNEGLPEQPGVHTVVQHTTVNIVGELPQDYIVWSLCNFVYMNPCCLGLAALISSIRARDRKVAGDLDGARRHASTARCLNTWATVLIVVLIFTLIILFSRYNSYNSYDPYN